MEMSQSEAREGAFGSALVGIQKALGKGSPIRRNILERDAAMNRQESAHPEAGELSAVIRKWPWQQVIVFPRMSQLHHFRVCKAREQDPPVVARAGLSQGNSQAGIC